MPLIIVRLKYIFLSAVILSLFAACSATKHLQPGESLLKSNKVIFQTDTTKKSEAITEQNLSLASKLLTLTKQKPNTKTLGIIRFNLGVYNTFYTEKKKGLSYFFMNKVGEPPVVFDSSLLLPSSNLMQQ